MVRLKRAYEPPAASDGYRVLVERLWPRGLRKEDAHLDAWLKDVAPSDELRKWFGHDPARWREFEERYERELRERGGAARAATESLMRQGESGDLTLVFAARDEEHNSAIVLKRELERRARRSRAPGRSHARALEK